MDKLKKGLIVADQTGVGKGRIAASIIRYAVLNGYYAIFVSITEDLFIDMSRDLSEINFYHPESVFATNLAAGVEYFYDNKKICNNSNRVYKDEKIIFTTYSQMNRGEGGREPENYWIGLINPQTGKPFGKEFDSVFLEEIQKPYDPSGQYWQKKLLLDLVENKKVILILDECHKAASINSNSSLFFNEIIDKASNTLFLSATYAKRPENLLLFNKNTMLSHFGSNELLTVLKRSGYFGQSILSTALVENGELIRREITYEGINFYTVFTGGEEPEKNTLTTTNQKTVSPLFEEYNKISHALKLLLMFDVYIKQPILGIGYEKIKIAGGSKKNKDLGINTSNPFSSRITNLSSQLDLVLKASDCIALAKRLHKENKKVVIFLMNTTGSLFDELYNIGDEVTNNFSTVLKKTHTEILSYYIRSGRGKGSTSVPMRITHEELAQYYLTPDLPFFKFLRMFTQASNALQLYKEIEGYIQTINLTKELSVIDYIKRELNSYGMLADEITGREFQIVKSGNKHYMEKRFGRTNKEELEGEKLTKKTHKPKVINAFNNGNLDCLIINVSGSTGISLHCGEKFKNQKQRAMIILQPHWDINVYMQALGRVNRTGQIKQPEYHTLNLPIPVAKRFAIMLKKKLSSLNANTKGDERDEQQLKKVLDMSNEAGDEAVERWYTKDENRVLIDFLGDPLNYFGTKPAQDRIITDQFLRFSGRLPILSVDEQEQVYNEIEENYRAVLLDWELEGKSLKSENQDWKAIKKGFSILVKPDLTTNNPILSEGAYINKYEIEAESFESVRKTIVDEVSQKDSDLFYNDLINKIKISTEEYFNKKRLTNPKFMPSENMINNIKDMINFINQKSIGNIFSFFDSSGDTKDVDYQEFKESLILVSIDYLPTDVPSNKSGLFLKFVSTGANTNKTKIICNLNQEFYKKLTNHESKFYDTIIRDSFSGEKSESAQWIDRIFKPDYENNFNKRLIVTGNLISFLINYPYAKFKFCKFTTHKNKLLTGLEVSKSFTEKNIEINLSMFLDWLCIEEDADTVYDESYIENILSKKDKRKEKSYTDISLYNTNKLHTVLKSKIANFERIIEINRYKRNTNLLSILISRKKSISGIFLKNEKLSDYLISPFVTLSTGGYYAEIKEDHFLDFAKVFFEIIDTFKIPFNHSVKLEFTEVDENDREINPTDVREQEINQLEIDYLAE